MMHKNNNNQEVFLELLVAAKNIKYFTSIKHKIFSRIFFKIWYMKRDVKSYDFECPM